MSREVGAGFRLPDRDGRSSSKKPNNSRRRPRDNLDQAPMPDDCFEVAESEGPEPDLLPAAPELEKGHPLPPGTAYGYRNTHLLSGTKFAITYTISFFVMLGMLCLVAMLRDKPLTDVTDNFLVRALAIGLGLVVVFFFSGAIPKGLKKLAKFS